MDRRLGGEDIVHIVEEFLVHSKHRRQIVVGARERIARLIAQETGQSLEEVLQDIDRDYWMSSEEAIKYGLVGRMINGRGEL